MSRAALISDLSSFPEAARSLVLGALGAQGPDDAALERVLAHHLLLDDEVATAHVVTSSALVRVQATRSGAYQRTVLPVSALVRVDELYQEGTLTVVLEIDADRTALTVVAAAVDGRFEAEGAMARNGWVLTSTGTEVARLSTFAVGARAALHQ